MRGRFGFFGILFVGLLALLVGGVAYSWGLAAGQTQVVAPGTTTVYATGFWHPFGFGIFGFVFFFLILGLIFSALRPRRWSGGPGGWGRGGWGGPGGHGGPGGPGGWGTRFDAGDVPPAFRPMLELWHRQAHGEPTAAGPSGPTTGPTPGAGTGTTPPDATPPPR